MLATGASLAPQVQQGNMTTLAALPLQRQEPANITSTPQQPGANFAWLLVRNKAQSLMACSTELQGDGGVLFAGMLYQICMPALGADVHAPQQQVFPRPMPPLVDKLCPTAILGKHCVVRTGATQQPSSQAGAHILQLPRGQQQGADLQCLVTHCIAWCSISSVGLHERGAYQLCVRWSVFTCMLSASLSLQTGSSAELHTRSRCCATIALCACQQQALNRPPTPLICF